MSGDDYQLTHNGQVVGRWGAGDELNGFLTDAIADLKGAPRQQAAAPEVIPDTVSEPARASMEAEAPMQTPMQTPVQTNVMPRLVAAALGVAAMGLAAVALASNVTYTSSLGQTVGSAWLLAALGFSIDVLAMILPSVVSECWHRRHFIAAGFASLIWIVAVAWTLMAVSGFSAVNIADTLAQRGRISDEAAATKDHLAVARAERATLSESRSLATIDQALAAAMNAARVQSGGLLSDCKNVSKPASLALCAPVAQLREAATVAARRDQLDAQIRGDEAALASTKVVSESDPGAHVASDLISFVTAGGVTISPLGIQRARVAGLSLMPTFSGLLFGLALMLWRKRE